MFFKKTRNLAVTALAFLMAICVGFGVMGFKNTQEVNAEKTTESIVFTAENGFVAMNKNDTKLINNNVKLIATNTVSLSTSSNKIGYRADGGRLVVILKLENTTDLTVYHNANSTGARYMELNSFVSEKNIEDITTSDYSTKTTIDVTSVEGYKIGNGVAGTLTSNKSTYSYSAKGGAKIVYTGLTAGYYVMIGAGSEAYLYGLDITYESDNTQYTVNSVTFDTTPTESLSVFENLTETEIKAKLSEQLPKNLKFNGVADGKESAYTAKITDWTLTKNQDSWTAKPVFDKLPSNYTWEETTHPVPTLTITVTPLTEITSLKLKDGQQETYDIIEGKAFDESQLPATVDGVYEGGTVDVAVTWSTEDSGVVAGGHYTYTAKWEAAPEGYKFAADIEALTITVNVNEDERPGIESVQEIEAIVVDEDDTCPLPEKVTANLTNKTTAQVSVEWDAVSTANPGVYEIKGKIVATDEDTYKAVGNLDVTVTVKVRGAYDSPFNAKWDITEVEDGTAWDGTSGSATAITQDHMLKDAMGIQIYAAEGTFSDNEHPSAMLNCVKVDPTKSTNAIKITVPQGFVGTISVKTGGYQKGKGKGAAWELVENNEVLQTVNFGDANTYYTSDGENADTEDDAYILEHHYELVFNKVNAAEAEGNYIIRIKDGSTNDKMYISSVAVDGELDSAKRFFVKGDKLNSITPRYGYTFIGWADADKPELGLLEEGYEVEEDGDFFVICAKVEYLGVSFRTEGATGVRYGFILRFYDHDDRDESVNSLKTEYIKSLNISLNSVTFAADVTSASGNQKTTTITLEKNKGLNYAYNDELFGYVANLVIMNVTAAEGEWNVGVKATFSLQVGETVKELAAEGAKETIKSKAEKAYNDGAFGNKEDKAAKDWAGKYGYTVA